MRKSTGNKPNNVRQGGGGGGGGVNFFCKNPLKKHNKTDTDSCIILYTVARYIKSDVIQTLFDLTYEN